MAFRGSVVSIGSVSPASNFSSGSQLRHAYSQRDINSISGPQYQSQHHIPLSTISAEELLSIDIDFSGFLYKRSSERKTDKITSVIQSKLSFPFAKWQLRYVILYKDWLYYFQSEKSKRPKGAFCLKGYHRVMRAEEASTTDQRYAFKIMGPSHNMRTYFFGAASEREMTLWMAHIRVTMEKALHGSARDRSLQLLKNLKEKSDRVFSQVCELDEQNNFRRDSVNSSDSQNEQIYDEIEKQLPLYDDTECLPDIGERPLPRPPAEWSPDSGNSKPASKVRKPLPAPPPRHDGYVVNKVPIASKRFSAELRSKFGMRFSTLDSDDDDEDENGCVQDYLSPTTATCPQRVSLTTAPKPQPRPPRRKCDEEPKNKFTNPHGLRRRPDGNSFRDKHSETHIGKKPPAPPKKPQISPKPNMTKPSSTYNKVGAIRDILPDSAIFEESDKVKAEEMLKGPKFEGMYLIRNSAQAGQKVLMVYHGNDKCKHYKIFGDGITNFSLDKTPVFKFMNDLLEHYSSSGLPNTARVLTKPYHD
ncbi:SH3 domain-binding protein 2-like isoform X2 [Antedon mediterranea]|uniref:SH3 domain-binding protein 2-like isoform X2 n=1 Tax=Antedon mediterranea TaxID=105859 RepID=UPI003AF95399